MDVPHRVLPELPQSFVEKFPHLQYFKCRLRKWPVGICDARKHRLGWKWEVSMEINFCFVSGVKITGLEVDRNWWSRQKSFIPLKFLEPDQEITSQFLLDTCMSRNWNFSLLFCYFNNRDAFDKYVSCYQGNFIIIIGPADNTLRYTEPLPLDTEFQKNQNFKLIHLREFGNNRDLIAIYEKNVKNLFA